MICSYLDCENTATITAGINGKINHVCFDHVLKVQSGNKEGFYQNE